jgi:transcriptional regulator with XRE-family HTH domain
MVDKVNKDLRKWTKGEQLWLWRRAGEYTQEEAARRLKIGERHYWEAENDLVSRATVALEGEPGLGDLCALARRRHGLLLRATAQMMGVSHVTLLAWERVGDPRLVNAWKNKGYLL